MDSGNVTVVPSTPVPLDMSPSVCPSGTCASLGNLAASPASPDLQCTVNSACDTISCEGYLLAIIPDLPSNLEETKYTSVTELFFCNETTNVLITISEPSSGNKPHSLYNSWALSLKDKPCMTFGLPWRWSYLCTYFVCTVFHYHHSLQEHF